MTSCREARLGAALLRSGAGDRREPLAPLATERHQAGRPATAGRCGVLRRLLAGVALVLLAFVNLGDYPKMWFDEGIHLHVPKAVVKYGVYADYSSEGFRYYGPTMSVGPTVMLPVALALRIGGIGILQARAVMALYLVAAVVAFFALARRIGGGRFAWIATLLLVSSPGLDLVWLGRQLLGEVPGLLFVAAGLAVFLNAWVRPSFWRLSAAGLLFGLAVVTKYQYLILLGPGLALAWMADRLYYRRLPSATFVVPLAVTVACFALWQVIGIAYLGPSVASENIRLMRTAAAGAAFSFSIDHLRRAATFLLSFQLYAFLLLPAVAYSAFRALERDIRSQMWTTVLCLTLPGLLWYATASIGWPRYAFAAGAIAALPVARFLGHLTDGFRWPGLPSANESGQELACPRALALMAWLWMLVAIVPGLLTVGFRVLHPPPNEAQAMAAYLERHVPQSALIETWEPELGFLTDHRYRYPPSTLLIDAVAFVWDAGPPPAARYDFLGAASPDYVLEGEFARWVQLYPAARLNRHYRLTAEFGAYRLYQRRTPGDAADAAEDESISR